MSLHVLVFNEVEDYRKVLLYCLSCKWPFLDILWFFALFAWCVIATSSWIFTPNVEKCDFK